MGSPLRIGFVTSELTPFAKTGGLADVSAALPRSLHARGHDVRPFLPLYSRIEHSRYHFARVDYLSDLEISLGEHRFRYDVYSTRLPGTELDVYFVHCPELYSRPGVYTGEWDEHLRYALLSRATLDAYQRMGWSPEVVHCNDWHTALVPLYLATLYSWDRDRFAGTRTVLTIHNIAFQGWFPSSILPNLGLAGFSELFFQEDLRQGMVNFLKTGLLYAGAVTTVSRTYAREIQTPLFGHGLDALLRERRSSVVGIVNGVDYAEWNPANDPHIRFPYDADTLVEGKARNRRHLLEQMKLPTDPAGPVLGIVSRLTAQKGFDLVFDPLADALRHLDLRLVVLGGGEERFEAAFTALERTFPGKVCYYRGYHEQLAHLIEAGADIFLMPSQFEPCGLNQMYSMRYGTPPVVRKTGGLADTVEPWNPATREGTGFVFEHYDRQGFSWALQQALLTFRDREAWNQLCRNGMERDHSWERQVLEYETLYRRLLGR